ncbi:MAG TPA: YHS domain-containing (seleno)protein [Thermohalobaculum sp.]|nr:YHS domain-containing (seleno)protein [Thermohalobaculum sp.]
MRIPTRTACAALLALVALGGAAAAEEPINTGLFGGVAIKGYDTVAYFTEGMAVKGSAEFSYEWLGAPWYFANAEHRSLFSSSPTKYAPQYGGYCTLGVGLDAHAAENIDPERAWRIIDGKLYFVYDPTYAEELDGPARDEWLAKAEANWPAVKVQIAQDFTN